MSKATPLQQFPRDVPSFPKFFSRGIARVSLTFTALDFSERSLCNDIPIYLTLLSIFSDASAEVEEHPVARAIY